MEAGTKRPVPHAVLVVADSRATRDDYATMLKIWSVEVATAWGASDALRTLGFGFRPCVILLAFRLAVDGAILRRALHRRPDFADVPVVLLATALQARALLVQGGSIVHQPVDAAVLLETVERECRQHPR